MIKLIISLNLFFLFFSIPSYAYLGPGIGGGILMATLGVIVAIFAALFGLIWFPVKRLLKKRKETFASNNFNTLASSIGRCNSTFVGRAGYFCVKGRKYCFIN